MKKIFFFTLFCLIFCVLNAKEYQIIRMNGNNVVIGGRTFKPGNIYSGKIVNINWDKSDATAFVVQEKGSGKQIKYSKVSPKKSSNKTTKKLSGRDLNTSLMDHKKSLEEDSLVLLDSAIFNTTWKSDSLRFFELSYSLNEKLYSKKLLSDKSRIIITREMFPIECISNKSETTITCKVEYVELDYNERTLITDKLNLIIVPKIDQ